MLIGGLDITEQRQAPSAAVKQVPASQTLDAHTSMLNPLKSSTVVPIDTCLPTST